MAIGLDFEKLQSGTRATVTTQLGTVQKRLRILSSLWVPKEARDICYPGVVQCAHRSLLRNRPARHLAVAILVALVKATSRASNPELLARIIF